MRERERERLINLVDSVTIDKYVTCLLCACDELFVHHSEFNSV